MSERLHLRPAPPMEAVMTDDPVYFVIQRSNGHWSPGAKIVHVVPLEVQAEALAARLKQEHPHQHYCVAKLRSEARVVETPIHIVRAPE